MVGHSESEPLVDDGPGNAAWDRDEFLAMISHEIRNSTQIIISWAELLCGRLGSDETVLKGLQVIRHNGRLQTRLLNQLLAFSRKPGGDFWLDAGRIALAPILEAAIQTMTPQALAKGIQLHAEVEPPAPSVVGDAVQLEEVLTNLLSNAIKFTPACGRIEVRLLCSNGSAEITVSDTGQGISADFLPHVFDRFRQERGNAAGDEGLGLGLAIARYLVERHHGKIYAASSGEGQGATFGVSFPLAPSLAAPGASPPETWLVSGHASD